MATLKRRMLTGTPEGWPSDVPQVMQDIYASRGVLHPEGIIQRLAKLHSPKLLGSIETAAALLTHAIINDQTIMVAGDYDCDGATGSAVAVRGLKLLGAKNVSFILPNRFVHGYGLSPALVADMQPTPDVIVTVDSGVSSVEGVAAAKARGITVIVTDHHLPGDILPAADAIVNPNLRGDLFPSKMLAGVGVMFYTLLYTRSYMRDLGMWKDSEPDLTALLDLVAIGTVADLVPLDQNNRILVEAGLRRIRSGQASVGIQALVKSAQKDAQRLVSTDIAFAIGPRLNAAGRLKDMRLGVLTLITDDVVEAEGYVAQLEEINKERREIQAGMIEEAEAMVLATAKTDAVGVVVYNPTWHAGIVGLVASKLKESLHRPVIAFAPPDEHGDKVSGSARSITGFHLRDALALIDAQNPDLIIKFGGHAMAAGLTIKIKDIPRFSKLFDDVARAGLDAEQLSAVVFSDGELPAGLLTLDFAYYVQECGPWGQGFPEPMFDNVFIVDDWTPMGKDMSHLRLNLIDPRDGTYVQAVFFGGYNGDPPPNKVRVGYSLSINVFRNSETLQLMVRHMEPA